MRRLIKDNKAQTFLGLGMLQELIMVFVTIGIIGMIGAKIIVSVNGSVSTGDVANSSAIAMYSLAGIKEVASWQSTLAVVVIAAIILSFVMLLRQAGGGQGGQGGA